MAGPHLDELAFVLERASDAISPFQMCPPFLFAEIIKINRVRRHAAKHGHDVAENLSQEAYGILDRINNFSAEPWAESKPSAKEDWTLMGNVYHVAVEMYCISSLQSLSVLPSTPSLRARCTIYGQLLQGLLHDALSSQRTKRFMIWPLVVLGVEAVHGTAAMQTFVKQQLLEMSRHTGSYAPLMAKAVFERFWYSGETDWDSCFDRPYAFTTQFSVDMSRILLS